MKSLIPFLFMALFAIVSCSDESQVKNEIDDELTDSLETNLDEELFLEGDEITEEFLIKAVGEGTYVMEEVTGDFGSSSGVKAYVYNLDVSYAVGFLLPTEDKGYKSNFPPEDEMKNEFMSFPQFNVKHMSFIDINEDGMNELIILINVGGKGGVMEDGERYEYDEVYQVIYGEEEGEIVLLDPKDHGLESAKNSRDIDIALGLLKEEQTITKPKEIIEYLKKNDHLRVYHEVTSNSKTLLRLHNTCMTMKVEIMEKCSDGCGDDRPYIWVDEIFDGRPYYLNKVVVKNYGAELYLTVEEGYDGGGIEGWNIQQTDGIEQINIDGSATPFVHEKCLYKLEEDTEECEDEEEW